MRLVLLSFLLLPLAEIAGFVLVGRLIGVLPVLLLTVAGVFLGIVLLRMQGAETLRKLAAESRAGRDASRPLVHAALIVVAAILLIIPGFLTDILGLLLFLPPVRDFVWSLVRPRIVVVRTERGGFSTGPEQPSEPTRSQGKVIDLEPEDYQSSRDNNGNERV
ncbi:FxsA family protein [Rhizobium sp. RU36D]|uniref:FxsA family protein n=1 Tax=Rhizobium sp. RU36D TaxID=1907415 RepID=UPI0009D7C165|nr:FxsA family protein [Rhizobium sp. RU36D]SMC89278.1 UPF0716 protein FxsA [Rhizobium sp. RU36D]